MDSKLLLSFKKVAEFENISQAAEQLGYAQSTVTTQIRQLENELGVKLFDRLGNHIYLTESGNSFLHYTEQILFLMDRAKGDLNGNHVPGGILKIAGIHSLCASILPQLIKEYKQEYPEVKIEVAIGSIRDVLEQVKTGSVDLGLYMEFAERTDDFVVAYEEKNPLLFLCGKDSRLCRKQDITLENIASEPFIATEKECCCHKKMKQLFFDKQLEPNIYFETDNTEIIKKFVENNIGITVLPELAVRTELCEHKLVKVDIDMTIPDALIRLIYHKNKWVTPAMKAFVDMIKKI